jgi:hypothetical protein
MAKLWMDDAMGGEVRLVCRIPRICGTCVGGRATDLFGGGDADAASVWKGQRPCRPPGLGV